MNNLALQIPTSSGGTQELPPPSGLPSQLTGDINTSGLPVLLTGYNLLFLGAIVLIVVMMMVSGIQMITSGGDSDKLQKARKRLMYSILGLILVVGAFAIVSLVIKVTGGKPSDLLKIKK
ncbi:hypothetical protein HYS93_00950 [Candidatus Daviesbacteria bacterium]|nr:hypothetical protein [Candidatus Daviesbacteria bacterium]